MNPPFQSKKAKLNTTKEEIQFQKTKSKDELRLKMYPPGKAPPELLQRISSHTNQQPVCEQSQSSSSKEPVVSWPDSLQ